MLYALIVCQYISISSLRLPFVCFVAMDLLAFAMSLIWEVTRVSLVTVSCTLQCFFTLYSTEKNKFFFQRFYKFFFSTVFYKFFFSTVLNFSTVLQQIMEFSVFFWQLIDWQNKNECSDDSKRLHFRTTEVNIL